MASCWREMESQIGKENTIAVCFRPEDNTNAEFSDSLAIGIDVVWNDRTNYQTLAKRLADFSPTAVVAAGWAYPEYQKLFFDRRLTRAKKIMAIDTQRSKSLRQSVGRILKRNLFRHVDGIMVAGERSWQMARYLGFAEQQIIRGTYGIDVAAYSKAAGIRASNAAWPKSFQFVGRYVEEKGIDVLVKAYRQYRHTTNDPWPLVTCGKGPLHELLQNQPGVTDRGFVQPEELPKLFAQAGAFVLPSRFEPWGQVIVEAAGSGLPIICTEACGAGVEVVHNYYNGLKVPTGDISALSKAFHWVHDNFHELPVFGQRSGEIAWAYDKAIWCDRIVHWIQNAS